MIRPPVTRRRAVPGPRTNQGRWTQRSALAQCGSRPIEALIEQPDGGALAAAATEPAQQPQRVQGGLRHP